MVAIDSVSNPCIQYPARNARLDLSSPFLRRPVGIFIPGIYGMREVIRDAYLWGQYMTIKQVGTSIGPAYSMEGGYVGGFPGMQTIDGDLTMRGATLFAVATLPAVPTVGEPRIFNFGIYGDTNFNFGIHSTGMWRYGGGAVLDTETIVPNKLYVLIARIASTGGITESGEFFINGRKLASNPSILSDYRYGLGLLIGDSTAGDKINVLMFGGVGSRWNDGMVNTFTNNPWIIFNSYRNFTFTRPGTQIARPSLDLAYTSTVTRS